MICYHLQLESQHLPLLNLVVLVSPVVFGDQDSAQVVSIALGQLLICLPPLFLQLLLLVVPLLLL